MRKQDVIKQYLPSQVIAGARAEAFAPSNIALCKYWGKRDKELNLPINSSLSISLNHLGSRTVITPLDAAQDEVWLNGQRVDGQDAFAQKVVRFLDLFRSEAGQAVKVDTHNNIPTAAGLASSASGFAALMLAINDFYSLNLEPSVLSAFARMGSGSASRSIYQGFAQWNMGEQADGMDSYAVPIDMPWPSLRIGLLKITTAAKKIDSRAGMQRTVESAPLYQSWPAQAAADIQTLRRAIQTQDFELLGQTAEQNALSMHATMIASWPPLLYWLPESVEAMHRIWELRRAGLDLYFTMDAGPNIKLLFQEQDSHAVMDAFPQLEVVNPFSPQA
ncbi:MAG: diphosphomevalonate decarboxylase [Pontibacterium sp.]